MIVAPAYSGVKVILFVARAVPPYTGPVSTSKVKEFVPSENEKSDPEVLTVNVSGVAASVIVKTSLSLIVIDGVLALHVQSPEEARVLTPETAPVVETVKAVEAMARVSDESPILIVSASVVA